MEPNRTFCPLPKTLEEFRERAKLLRQENEARKEEFKKLTLEGFENAREMYFKLVSHLYFLVNETDDFVERYGKGPYIDCGPTNKPNYNATLRYLHQVLIISLRKVAECDYYLGFNDESLEICYKLIEIMEKLELPKSWMKMTHSVMVRVYIEKLDFKSAWKYLKMGLELDSYSNILGLCEKFMEKLVHWYEEKSGMEILTRFFKRRIRSIYRWNYSPDNHQDQESFEDVEENDYGATIDLYTEKGIFETRYDPNMFEKLQNPECCVSFVNFKSVGYERKEIVPIHLPGTRNSVDFYEMERIEYLQCEEMVKGSGPVVEIVFCDENESVIFWKSIFV